MRATAIRRVNSSGYRNFEYESNENTAGPATFTLFGPTSGFANGTTTTKETTRMRKELTQPTIRPTHDSISNRIRPTKSQMSTRPARYVEGTERQQHPEPYQSQKRQKFRRRNPPATLRLLRDAFLVYLALMSLSLKCAVLLCDAFSIRDVIRVSGKRTTALDVVICPTWHPFQCPNGECIPIKYLCDGSPDCSDEYDEDKRMCTAAVRPPVEETAAFLKALLSAHGADFLVKLFGAKAKDSMRAMGGVERVAVAISQSPTIETFGTEMGLRESEVAQLAALFDAIIAGETSELTSDEAGDFRFFVQKLQETGFF